MYLQSSHIDYLRLALHVRTSEHQVLIKDNLERIANSLSSMLSVPPSQIFHSKNSYEIFMRLPLFSQFNYSSKNEETPHIVIQCSYKYETTSRYFITIECKGHPYTRQQFFAVRLWLEYILGFELFEIYKDKILVTKIDVALNTNLALSNYLFDSSWSKKVATFTSANGDIETLYIQPKNKSLEICIYDRGAKIRNRGILKKLRSPSRIEFRFGKQKVLLSNYTTNNDSFHKAFVRLKIYDFSKVVDSELFNDDQLMALKSVGLKPYLQKASKLEREKLRKKLKPFLCAFIKPSSSQKLWDEALRKIKYLDPSKNFKGDSAVRVRKEFVSTYFITQ
ncbi:hypothetical protein [Pseudoalteromonas lipolytica]|uniref:hypothetical protein n=1 Tax=Pseudoalteromonas lipolytica TaxID=570156 RepID=UPI0030A8266D